MKRKTGALAALAVLLVAILAVNAFAGTAGGNGSVTKVQGGIKAVLKVSETMVDLFLEDTATGKAITEAVVKAHITTPAGKRIEKDLMGMKMGAAYSFMNSLDASAKGVYRLNISVKTMAKEARFDFDHRVE